MEPRFVIGLNAVIIAVTDEAPRILTVRHAEHSFALPPEKKNWSRTEEGAISDALPFGPLDPISDRTLDRGLRRWVREQTGIQLGYVEQLYTFGDRNRDPQERQGGARVFSIAYMALVREVPPSGEGKAHWRDWYRFFPWEDWRKGRPGAINHAIAPALIRWVRDSPDNATRRDRRERVDITFGLGGVAWDGERVLERYELLYEVGLAAEARFAGIHLPGKHISIRRSGMQSIGAPNLHLGEPMALDHRRILATALGRLRGKLRYRPVVFELLPSSFTLLQLQRVVEALAGVKLHKQNLRRLVEKGGLVERTGQFDAKTGGRPAELFRFRREVLRERPAPGVGLPGIRHIG